MIITILYGSENFVLVIDANYVTLDCGLCCFDCYEGNLYAKPVTPIFSQCIPFEHVNEISNKAGLILWKKECKTIATKIGEGIIIEDFVD